MTCASYVLSPVADKNRYCVRRTLQSNVFFFFVYRPFRSFSDGFFRFLFFFLLSFAPTSFLFHLASWSTITAGGRKTERKKSIKTRVKVWGWKAKVSREETLSWRAIITKRRESLYDNGEQDRRNLACKKPSSLFSLSEIFLICVLFVWAARNPSYFSSRKAGRRECFAKIGKRKKKKNYRGKNYNQNRWRRKDYREFRRKLFDYGLDDFGGYFSKRPLEARTAFRSGQSRKPEGREEWERVWRAW